MIRSTLFKSRGLISQRVIRSNFRNYGTRSVEDSPFDHLPLRKKPFFSWKATGIFFLLGSALAYNETLFNLYESMTTVENEDDEILPLQLEYNLKQLPIYTKLNHPSENNKWIKMQSWENLDRNVLDNKEFKVKLEKGYKAQSIVTHTLSKAGGILIKPIIFYNPETNETVTIIHAGYRLCGYPFIVHGGILASFLNETYKRNASLSTQTSSNLKDDFKVENLTINYKNPTFANQFLIIKTKQRELIDKRTTELESVIESQKGKILVKSVATLHDTKRATNQKQKRWLL